MLAFLNKGISISLVDERISPPKRIEFKFEGGLKEFVEYLNKNKTVIHKEVIYFVGTRDDVEIEVGIQYNDGYNETLFTFVNGINTREGGTHLVGFRNAMTKVFNDFFKRSKFSKKIEENLSGDDVREGLTAVLSIKVMEPQFEGQTKSRLGNSEVKGIVEGFVSDQLDLYFQKNPDVVDIILDKCTAAARARIAARQARELTRRKNLLEASSSLVSWLIAKKGILQSANFLSLRAIPQADRPKWAAIEPFKQSFLYGARCSMLKNLELTKSLATINCSPSLLASVLELAKISIFLNCVIIK